MSSETQSTLSDEDQRVLKAVRRVLVHELGIGERKFRRLIDGELTYVLREEVQKWLGRQDVTELVKATVAEIQSQRERAESSFQEFSSEIEDATRRSLKEISVQATVAKGALAQRAVETAVMERLKSSPAVGIAASKLLADFKEALERTAREEIRDFLESNFNVKIMPKPGRKIVLPG